MTEKKSEENRPLGNDVQFRPANLNFKVWRMMLRHMRRMTKGQLCCDLFNSQIGIQGHKLSFVNQ